MLHVPTFQQEYSQYWDDPEAASTSFVIRLLLVLAIGTCFYKGSTSVALRLSAAIWIYTAQSYLSSPTEKARLTLPDLQTHCLLLIARQACAIGGDLIWISAGSLLRTAIHMGFHRDPSRLPKMNVFQAELRRRLWATILEITIQSSMDSGGPPLISCLDYDCEPPANVNDHEIYEDLKTPPVSKPAATFTQTSIQITLVKSFSVRLEVVKSINDFRSNTSYDETLRIGKELTASYRTNSMLFQTWLASDAPIPEAKPTTFHKLIHELMTHRFLFALHFPFSVMAHTNPVYYFSRKVCLETALSLLSAPTLGEPDDEGIGGDDFTRLIVLGKGIYRAVYLQCASTVCWELINQIQEDEALFSSASHTQTRAEFHAVVHKFGDIVSRRVRAGETNIKGLVFFSAIMGETDAMHAGNSAVEAEMIARVRKSLEVGHTLLTERAAEIAAAQQFLASGMELGLPNTELDWATWDPLVCYPMGRVLEYVDYMLTPDRKTLRVSTWESPTSGSFRAGLLLTLLGGRSEFTVRMGAGLSGWAYKDTHKPLCGNWRTFWDLTSLH